MKKYSENNWNLLVIACILGVVYAGYLIYHSLGVITEAGISSIGLVALLVIVLLWLAARCLRDKRKR